MAFGCESLTLMGEGRTPNIPQMGDVVLMNTGHDV